ncbi:MAG TPA: hypothetical protein VFK44_06785 [Bacillales bacterium]|nr:hypothetical protein [Bacillales bacterium]
MWSVHQRLAELWLKASSGKEWTSEDERDFRHCMEANLKKAQKLSRLYNESLVASMANDAEWNHDICERIEKEKERMA